MNTPRRAVLSGMLIIAVSLLAGCSAASDDPTDMASDLVEANESEASGEETVIEDPVEPEPLAPVAPDAIDPCAEAIYVPGGPMRTTDDLGEVIIDTIEYINEVGGVEVGLGEGYLSMIYNPGIEPYFVHVFDDGMAIPMEHQGFENHFDLWLLIETFENQKEFVPQYTDEYDNIGAENGFLLDHQRFTQPGVIMTNVILNEEGRIKAVCQEGGYSWAYEYGLTPERQEQFAAFDPSEWETVDTPETQIR